MTPPDALKSAVRQLLKNPGFSAVAALTLALGAGPGDSWGAQSQIERYCSNPNCDCQEVILDLAQVRDGIHS